MQYTRATAFALFPKSQRKWMSKPLSPESISLFKSRLVSFGYDQDHILPHGSYLINLGNPDVYCSFFCLNIMCFTLKFFFKLVAKNARNLTFAFLMT